LALVKSDLGLMYVQFIKSLNSTVDLYNKSSLPTLTQSSFKSLLVLPGFSYMGIFPEALRIPRKAVPALHVPAGTVAIAGQQTGIYPVDSPRGL